VIYDQKDGNYLSSFEPIKDHDGKIIGIIGIYTDANCRGGHYLYKPYEDVCIPIFHAFLKS